MNVKAYTDRFLLLKRAINSDCGIVEVNWKNVQIVLCIKCGKQSRYD